MFIEGMPKSIEEQIASEDLEKAMLDLFAIKMADLGYPDWTIDNQGDFWKTDPRRLKLVKDALREDICRVLFKIRVDGQDDNSAIG